MKHQVIPVSKDKAWLEDNIRRVAGVNKYYRPIQLMQLGESAVLAGLVIGGTTIGQDTLNAINLHDEVARKKGFDARMQRLLQAAAILQKMAQSA